MQHQRLHFSQGILFISIYWTQQLTIKPFSQQTFDRKSTAGTNFHKMFDLRMSQRLRPVTG